MRVVVDVVAVVVVVVAGVVMRWHGLFPSRRTSRLRHPSDRSRPNMDGGVDERLMTWRRPVCFLLRPRRLSTGERAGWRSERRGSPVARQPTRGGGQRRVR